MFGALMISVSLTIFSSMLANYYIRLIIRYRRTDSTLLTPTPVSDLPLNPLLTSATQSRLHTIRRAQEFWSNLATKAYVAVVVLAVASGLVNALFESPSWFPFLALAMPFVGAVFVYKAWAFE